MKKITAICLLCAMSVSLLTSCGEPNLEGKWSLCNANGDELDYEIRFEDDGTVKIDDEKGKYEVIDKDTVEIKIDGEKYECDFEIIDKDEELIYLGEFSDKEEKKYLNSRAVILRKAVDSAVTDLYEEDIYYLDDAIICSDNSKNINPIPKNASSDFDFIHDVVKPFFGAVDNYEYIILIQDDKCVKTAIRQLSGNVIGTFPPSTFEEMKDMTFDEIYEEMKKSIE